MRIGMAALLVGAAFILSMGWAFVQWLRPSAMMHLLAVLSLC